MNTSKAKKTTKSKEERPVIEIREVGVKNVRVVDGKSGDLVFFTLELNGISIYNCRVATGKNGDFISWPQTKGKDGNYYNVAYASLSDEDSNKIIALVQEAIDNQ